MRVGWRKDGQVDDDTKERWRAVDHWLDAENYQPETDEITTRVRTDQAARARRP